MKKLMVAIAAVATAFGLYADGQALNTAFVANDKPAGQFTPEAPGWAAYTGDASKLIITEDTPKMLDISTGTAALKRNVANDGAAWVLDSDVNKNLYFDTTIDFKGQVLDEVPDVTGGKLAIFALDGTEINGLPDGTNVYVYAGYGTDSKALYLLSGFDADFPAEDVGHRIIVKTWANVFSGATPRSGFILYIQNGSAVPETLADNDIAKVNAAYTFDGTMWVAQTITAAGAYLGDAAASVDGTYGKWVNQRSLFLNLDAGASSTEEFTTLDFQGNAKIAGVNITDVAPVNFPADSFSMKVEADVTFTISPDTVTLVNGQLVSPTLQSVTITPEEKDILVVKKGETVIPNVNGTFTFDFTDGDTLYVHGADKKATVTINDVDTPCESIADAIKLANGADAAATITLNGAIANDGKLTFSNANGTVLDLYGYALSGNCSLNPLIENTGVLTIKDSVGTGSIENTKGATSVAVQNKGTLEINGGEMKTPVKNDSEKTLTITGGKFNTAFTNNGTIVTTGGNFLASVFGTKTENTIPGIQDGYVVVDDQLANYLTVVEKPKNYVVQIGDDGEKYESLGAAIDALAGDKTITLLADYTLTADETKIFTKNATLDLGTKTLTIPDALRTSPASFEVAKGAAVTIQNGTIDLGSATAASYGIAVLGTLNVNCTITRGSASGKSGPVFDVYDGTVNFLANADITTDQDIVRVKSLRGDDDEETDVTTTVTVADGAKLKATGTGKPIFYCYKSCTTLKATLNGGEFTANEAVFGDDNKMTNYWSTAKDGTVSYNKKEEHWSVTINAEKAKFANTKIEYGSAVDQIIPNQKPILNQADNWYYLQDAAKVAITADDTKVTVAGVAAGDKFAAGETVAFTVTEIDSAKDVIDAVTVNGDTLTAPYSWTVPATLPESIAIVVTTKAAQSGPVTPDAGGGSVEPVPGETGVYVVTPDSSSKNVTIVEGSLKLTDIIRVTTTEDITITGVPAVQIQVKIADTVIPNGAFMGGIPFSTALNPAGTVMIDKEEIPVTPTIADVAGEDTFDIADGKVATKAIPGLTYTLNRSTVLGGVQAQADQAKATTTTVELSDKIDGEKPAAAFYQIKVTK